MQINIGRFFVDEKDLFVLCYMLLVICLGIFKVPVAPFRYESLLVTALFMLVSRTMVNSVKMNSYFLILLSGLLFSLFLSPYGLAIYLFIAIVLYTKTNLL